MLDIKHIRDNQQEVVALLTRRGVTDAADAIGTLINLHDERQEYLLKLEEYNRKRNEMAHANKHGKPDATTVKRGAEIKQHIRDTQEHLEKILGTYNDLLRSLPNIPLADVPEGDADNNEVVAESDTQKPSGERKDYLTLLGHSIDLERGAKVSGSRFVYISGKLARLEIALVSFIFDELAKQHFTPVVPPVLVKQAAMAGMGYLDHDGDEIYKTQDDLYLVGTSEQAIGPMHMDEILDAESLPLRYVGYSSCFRREAGSHGKDVRGILRLHQFEKVEMFSFTTPEQSEGEHELLLSQQRVIMDALALPYRVVKLAAKDLGSPAAKTYDIETWIPSEGTYRETHSTSNTTDYQARRLNIRVRMDNKNVYAHMLNGTAIALSRILIALIENHQQPDGTVAIPPALHPYLPFTEL